MHFVRCETVDVDYVDPSASWQQAQPVTYHGHPGKPPLTIDAQAQSRFEEVVRSQPLDPALGATLVLGEEATLPTGWDPHTPGRVTIVRCDPIDGTSGLAHCGDGFSSVVTIDSRSSPGEPWIHLSGAIVRSDGRTLSWSRESVYNHNVVCDMKPLEPDEAPPIMTFGALPPFRTRQVNEDVRLEIAAAGAVVAAHSKKRREAVLDRFSGLVRKAGHFEFRSGSTSAWPLCNFVLGFALELNATTIHDAALLYPFEHLGGKIIDHKFEVLNFRKTCEEHAGPGAIEKIIPPYFAFTQSESLELVQESLAR